MKQIKHTALIHIKKDNNSSEKKKKKKAKKLQKRLLKGIKVFPKKKKKASTWSRTIQKPS